MDNIKPTLDCLLRALSMLPQDNALSEARNHIRQAAASIDKVQSRRKKRQVQEEEQTEAQKWKNTLVSGILNNPLSGDRAKDALKKIEQMIGEEEQKQKKGGKETETGLIVN